MGQFVPILAEREAFVWELAEAAYYSSFPATATGVSMDLAVSYSGVTRLQPSPTTARVVLFGEPGTVVPVGAEMETTAAALDGSRTPRFRILEEVIISGSKAALMVVEVPAAPITGTLYYLDWNGIRAAAVASSGDNSAAVLVKLRDALLGVGATAAIVAGDLHVTSDGTFAGAISPTLAIKSLGSPGRAAALANGPHPLPAGTLTRILTPVSGWASVYNPLAGIPGRELEADDELRSRYKLGVFRLGSGTVPSIRANLEQDIAGVVSAVRLRKHDRRDRPRRPLAAFDGGGDRGRRRSGDRRADIQAQAGRHPRAWQHAALCPGRGRLPASDPVFAAGIARHLGQGQLDDDRRGAGERQRRGAGDLGDPGGGRPLAAGPERVPATHRRRGVFGGDRHCEGDDHRGGDRAEQFPAGRGRLHRERHSDRRAAAGAVQSREGEYSLVGVRVRAKPFPRRA